MLGRVWEGGEGEWSASLGEARSKRAQLAADLGMTGSVCLPVFGDGSLLGILEFFGSKVEDPGELFLDVHSGIGRQIGAYMERKRAEGEADRAKDEFFALVSHELRTPLTSIIGYLELMQEDDGIDTDEHKHFLEIVHRNADRLLRLVGDLLLVAQVQAGKFALRPGPIDLNSIAEHAVEAARPIATGRTIGLLLKCEPVPVFQGDRDRVAQLFDNLISNALKFTDPGERVSVRVTSANARAVVEINNSGSVIPPAEKDRLFDRFYRASDATARVVPGIGLGLAIVKAIVEAHGGTIRVDSDPSIGTTFRFTLPLAMASAPTPLDEAREAA
jgi:signal transduction histidine kinase